MKIVDKMTQKAWDYVGLTRCPEHDFSDDGTRFKAYAYKGIPLVSYTTSDGEKFLAINPDNTNYGGTSYDFWKANAESNKCTWDFNGCTEIDLDKLKENLEAVYQDLQTIGQKYKDYMAKNKETFKSLRKTEISCAIAIYTEGLKTIKSADLFDEHYSKWDVERLRDNYKSLRRDLEQARKDLLAVVNDSAEERLLEKKYYTSNYYITSSEEIIAKAKAA